MSDRRNGYSGAGRYAPSSLLGGLQSPICQSNSVACRCEVCMTVIRAREAAERLPGIEERKAIALERLVQIAEIYMKHKGILVR